jgi:hypothetical protein
MKCVGKAKLLNMEFEVKRTVGKIYFATNVGTKEEPEFENDFCNVVLVGKAHKLIKEIAKMDDVDKMPIYITESQLRLKSGKREDGTYWTYNELVVFDFEEVEQQREERPKSTRQSQRRGRR